MLIRFSCKNFKSIGMEPITLEMVSSAKIRMMRSHICASSSDVKVLRNAVIYGGNAAGKSSIIKAMSFMKAAVVSGSIPQEGMREYCKCGNGHTNDETTFDVQFQMAGKTYDYGFSCILSKLEITSEWLLELGKKNSVVFNRVGSDELDCSELERTLADEDRTRLDVYKGDFMSENRSAASTELFLTSMASGKAFDSESPLKVFADVLQWFNSGIEIVGAGTPTSSTEFYADDKTLEQVATVLASFDTGIDRLDKQEVPMDELDKYVPVEVLLALRDLLQSNPPKSQEAHFIMTVRNENFFLGVERDGLQEPHATILRTTHSGSSLDFDFHDESDGTRRLFDFMDLLFTKSEDKVFVVDELSRSFHPMLTQQLVTLFNRVHADDDCQLVFTTHENDVMSYEYFRRDEIWFVDRSADGVSTLYPLDDFASGDARSDARLNKRYLEGRYGGVPVLSEAKALAALGVKEA